MADPSPVGGNPYAQRKVEPVDVLVACETLLIAGFTEEALSVLASVLKQAGSLRAVGALWNEAERRNG